MLTRLRGSLNKIVVKVAYICQRSNLSPNLITLLGLAISVLAIPSAIYGNHLLLFLVIVAASFMDVLDGALARLSGRVTAFGGVLDSVCDRIEESIFLFSLHFTGVSMYLIFIGFTISYTISYLRALGETRGVKMEGIGLLERGERLILIAITVILLSVPNIKLGTLLSIHLYEIPIALLVILGIVTIVQRISYLYTSFKNSVRM